MIHPIHIYESKDNSSDELYRFLFVLYIVCIVWCIFSTKLKRYS